MELLKVIVSITSVFSILITAASCIVHGPCDIPAIYNFGDSNSDTGGAAAAFPPLLPPNGQTFFGRPAGRMSDGRLIIDFFAEHLGMPYLSAYLNSIKPNFTHGANFATVDATIQHQSTSLFQNYINPFSLDAQVNHFDYFKTQTSYFYYQATEESERRGLPRPHDFSKALYTIDIGQNDLANYIIKMSKQQTLAKIPGIIKDFATAVQQLYVKGARVFWVHNTGPIGCSPSATLGIWNNAVTGGLDEYGCVQDENDIAMEFNKQLKNRVVQLRAELPQAALTYVDMYTAKYKLITDAKNQGFEDPFKICCGYNENGTSIWCGYSGIVNGTKIVAGSCPNPSRVISWDGSHYTEAANMWLANHIINGSLSDPPVSISQACVTTTLECSTFE